MLQCLIVQNFKCWETRGLHSMQGGVPSLFNALYISLPKNLLAARMFSYTCVFVKGHVSECDIVTQCTKVWQASFMTHLALRVPLIIIPRAFSSLHIRQPMPVITSLISCEGNHRRFIFQRWSITALKGKIFRPLLPLKTAQAGGQSRLMHVSVSHYILQQWFFLSIRERTDLALSWSSEDISICFHASKCARPPATCRLPPRVHVVSP